MVDPVAILTLISDQAIAIRQLSERNEYLENKLREKGDERINLGEADN